MGNHGVMEEEKVEDVGVAGKGVGMQSEIDIGQGAQIHTNRFGALAEGEGLGEEPEKEELDIVQKITEEESGLKEKEGVEKFNDSYYEGVIAIRAESSLVP